MTHRTPSFAAKAYTEISATYWKQYITELVYYQPIQPPGLQPAPLTDGHNRHNRSFQAAGARVKEQRFPRGAELKECRACQKDNPVHIGNPQITRIIGR